MEEAAESDPDLGFGSSFGFGSIPPALVSLAPFTPAPSPAARRLSSQFAEPSRPVPSGRRLAYVSLQGRLVNAEEATSARAIGGGLGQEEVAAWELFSPIQRVLLVAVVAAAVAESRKNRLILQLRNSVELRVCDLLRNFKEIIICVSCLKRGSIFIMLFGISYIVD